MCDILLLCYKLEEEERQRREEEMAKVRAEEESRQQALTKALELEERREKVRCAPCSGDECEECGDVSVRSVRSVMMCVCGDVCFMVCVAMMSVCVPSLQRRD